MRTINKAAVALATVGLACAGFTPAQAEITSAYANTEGAPTEEWTPVAKPQALDSGPQPGTTCERVGATAEYVEITGSRFDVEGSASAANTLDEGEIPLKQTINESKTKKWWTSVNVSVKYTEEITRKYGWEYSREMIWSMGQNIGPYPIYPGEIGTLRWGFIVDEFIGHRVRCNSNRTWEQLGAQFYGVAPRERHVDVTVRQLDS
ncbi:hypothetical protein EML15_03485 [Corynebacterium sp. sy017]|uniref:hypothetical protein n=1 Tax=unclassified Corynebacterium TaxID=2624378 RepID=UPI001184BF1F|nr:MULTISPECIES: hypothetical protein [unclassified Corynebacterium]MBP3088211.1 hypothetical protein [Corynebacterium sp. sy017]QDZ43401.1 hypothetical protein FQV43_09785 [Corynebacterium sp. sy039]TSD91545.1 hypothetical protein ELY17_03485 [Corynebacterium sp. SY003]